MADNLFLFVFLLSSMVLACISRASLRVPGSHGFYRFFAWECILALFLINAGAWFVDPFTPLHLVSWIFLTLSGFLVLHAFFLLRRHGRPDPKRRDGHLLGIERTTALVTEGIYRYIRHPLYSSLLFLAWGICLKAIGWGTVLLALAATGFLMATAKADEAESLRFFGPAYEEYRKRTKMFIPYLL
jgi:protein-S-isoprenylcysteine O-methyltransferase Ste14